MNVPQRPSNRHLFDTMIAWGWKPGKPSNGHVEMIWDGPGVVKTRVTIAQSGHHAATTDEVVKMVIQLTTAGNREKFWNKLPPIRSTREPRPEETDMVKLTPVQPVQQPRKQRKHQRGAAAQALAILINNGGTMGVNVIHKEMPDFSRAQVTTACCYLVTIGKAERVMMNIYRARTTLQNGPTVHVDHEGSVGTATMPRIEEVMERAHLVVKDEFPSQGTSTQPKLEVEPPSEDATMNLVLDLMFPNGFKAAHFPIIEAWKNITRNLMKEVQS